MLGVKDHISLSIKYCLSKEWTTLALNLRQIDQPKGRWGRESVDIRSRSASLEAVVQNVSWYYFTL